MLGKSERREAAREFKERKPAPGIYALRCLPTGRSWVEVSPNLASAQNSQYFQLRQHLHRNHDLQAAWNQYGEQSFAFEVLETIPEDTPALNLRDLLKQRKHAWEEFEAAHRTSNVSNSSVTGNRLS
jgi:hypothetical protein